MPSDIHELVLQLRDAAERYDKDATADYCQTILAWLDLDGTALSPRQARQVLLELRRNRWFGLLEGAASSFRRCPELDDTHVRLQWVQARIDQGAFEEAIFELEEILAGEPKDRLAWSEAWGLRGRIHKQKYVEARDPQEAAELLSRAIEAYRVPFEHDPTRYFWQGINVVACAARAEHDGISIEPRVDWREVARTIYDEVSQYGPRDEDYTWAVAAALEASVALGEPRRAESWAMRYVNAPYADAFELGSTLRQLREVWRLDRTADEYDMILRLLASTHLKRGGRIDLGPSELGWLTDRQPAGVQLQANYANEAMRTLRWLETALARCRCVARVEDPVGQATGTGFLVRGRELCPQWGDRPVFVTNAHVVGPDGFIRPKVARARFMAAPDPHGRETFAFTELLWTSPRESLDTSILALAGDPPPVGVLAVCERDAIRCNEKTRLTVVGHPDGAEPMISLYGNYFAAFHEPEKPKVVRYRTPTERGSSGSPVFTEYWEVMAVHHAALEGLQLNEGILMERIKGALHQDRVRGDTK